MTSLEEFLNKKQSSIEDHFDPVEGTFQCQNQECNVVTYEAFFDTSHNNIKWVCSNGHDSSVKI